MWVMYGFIDIEFLRIQDLSKQCPTSPLPRNSAVAEEVKKQREPDWDFGTKMVNICQWYHLKGSSLKIFFHDTVKPVCNDHLYNKIYHPWYIQ